MGWIDEWLNKEEVKKALGAPANLKFESCNMQVNQGFFFQGDGMHDSSALLPPLLNDGIKLLVYAGTDLTRLKKNETDCALRHR